MPIKPTGNKAPTRSGRSLTTPGASIKFSTNVGTTENNDVPGLIIDARFIKDAAPKDVSLSAEYLSKIVDLTTLKVTVTSAFDANRDYLEATGTSGNNEALATAGSRKQAFFGSIEKDLSGTKLPEEDYAAARRMLKALEEATYMGHTIEFDTAKLDTYHPYSRPFDRGVRKLESLAPEGIERDNITHELDYITDRKTRNGWGNVNERNAEATLGLRVIDRGNGNQTVSLASDSINPRDPAYVIINVNEDGLPEEFVDHAGKAVIRDGENLFFDKTKTPLPAILAAHLTEKSASSRLGLRAMEDAEDARKDFPYDWTRNNSIDVDPINTGWWGHCHIEAPLASLSVGAGSDVTVFDERSKAVQTFGDTDVNDLLFAMLDTTMYADINTNGPAITGKTNYVGNRNDTIGSPNAGNKLILNVNGVEYPFNVSIIGLFDSTNPEQMRNPEEVFSPTVVTEGIEFKKNPEYQGAWNRDWSTINGERKMHIVAEYMDVSDSGSVKRERAGKTIDPANPSEEPVLLGSILGRSGFPPEVTKFYLNEKSGQLESRTFKPEKQEDGTYTMVATSEDATVIGDVTSRVLRQELVKESIIGLHDHVLNAARRGVAFVTEKFPGNQVWNYGTDAMTMTRLEEDGDFVKYSIELKTQGGRIKWEYILQYDANGVPVDAHALGDPADFVWRPERWVSTPLFRGDDGRLLYNSSASERGFLLGGDGEITSDGMSFFRYASDVIYASLADPKKDNRYVVIDANGELYFYEDIEAYRADVTALGGDATTVSDPVDSGTPGLVDVVPQWLTDLGNAVAGTLDDESGTSGSSGSDFADAVVGEVIGSVTNLLPSASDIVSSIADGLGALFGPVPPR